MNTKQLYRALAKNKVTKNTFDGIYAKDTLEDIQSQPGFVIANTANSSHPGQHWVVFFFEGKNNGEFFDSLGNELSSYGKEFNDFMSRFSSSYNFTTFRTQPAKTALCGVYCLYFALRKCQGASFDVVINELKKKNSYKVCQFVKKNFPLCKPFACQLVQCCRIK
jgi:hypothetical protein